MTIVSNGNMMLKEVKIEPIYSVQNSSNLNPSTINTNNSSLSFMSSTNSMRSIKTEEKNCLCKLFIKKKLYIYFVLSFAKYFW